MATLDRLNRLVLQWQDVGDRRALFAEAYAGMTAAMLEGVAAGGFTDGPWVGRLLDRFADYYFEAVEDFDRCATCPQVWHHAFEGSRHDDLSPVQVVLLGINAHINHDLPLALADVLDDWPSLDAATRENRHGDHEHVNVIIERSTDLVQELVVNRAAPALALVDRLLGPVDEAIFTGVVSSWRAHAWSDAQRLVMAPDPEARRAARADIDERALRWARLITLA